MLALVSNNFCKIRVKIFFVVCFYCIQLYLTNFCISPNFYQKLSKILGVNFFTLLGLLLVVANVVSSSGSAGGISAAKYSGAGSATKSSTAQSSHHSKSVLKHLLPTLLVYRGLSCI